MLTFISRVILLLGLGIVLVYGVPDMGFTLPPVIEHLLPQEVLPPAPTGSHGQSSTTTSETGVPTTTESTLPQTPITATDSNSATTSNSISPINLLQSPINQLARRSIVNVTCRVQDNHTIRTTSGSGILIDKRGVVLTNAHVAYLYLLAGKDSNEDISCAVRTGNPASTTYQAVPLYISEAWIHDNARNIAEDEFYGTGEHDYALLAITGGPNGTTAGIPSFSALSLSNTPGTPTVASEVLVMAYPAEFLRGEDIRHDLYLTSDVGKVENQFTFMRTSPDLVTISGTILAQRGASGGAVVTKEGKLSGLVVTSTDAPDLKDRQLGAITISYINRDLEYQTDKNIREFLDTDLSSQADHFTKMIAPGLAKELRYASE